MVLKHLQCQRLEDCLVSKDDSWDVRPPSVVFLTAITSSH